MERREVVLATSTVAITLVQPLKSLIPVAFYNVNTSTTHTEENQRRKGHLMGIFSSLAISSIHEAV